MTQCHNLWEGVIALSHMPEKFWLKRLKRYETVTRDNSSPVPFNEIYQTGEYMHAYFTHRNPAVFDA